ncbi:uncharacterized protein LOC124606493 [Schistocerca americana]|uniref:uncharacterized protein LOC124606493 n=1 Tax=Schistocerca americana TaxID=7009 RepID=UPI001F4F1B97|nr:uncharacterized protein LOC124606493 [Schistocerca americana]
MASQHVSVLGLVGLVVAPAVLATLGVNGSAELKAFGRSGALNVSTQVGPPPRLVAIVRKGVQRFRGLRGAMGRLLKTGGREFFRVLSSVLPGTAGLNVLVSRSGPVATDNVNKAFDEFCSSLNQMVKTKVITVANAEALRNQTARELMKVLQEKIGVNQIKGSSDCVNGTL